MTTSLSIIVPCYNEEKNLLKLLNAFEKVIHREDIELVVVDNGSTDGSYDLLKKIVPDFKFARLHHIPINKGYGFGILSGLEAAKGDFLGWTHADLQTDPKDVIKAFDIIELHNLDPNIYVKGDRKGRPLFDQFFTSGMSIFESLYLKTKLWDINAQPNIFHRSFYSTWKDNAPHDFSLDLYVLYMASIMRIDIKRIDVHFPDRQHGESSWNTGLSSKWKFIKRTVEFSIELKKELKHDALYRS